jgi:hypothetical protein
MQSLPKRERKKIWEGIPQEQACKPLREQHKVRSRWSLPCTGWAKPNLDTGCGVVMHDHLGAVMISWRYLENVTSPEEAEALACLEGLRATVDWI